MDVQEWVSLGYQYPIPTEDKKRLSEILSQFHFESPWMDHANHDKGTVDFWVSHMMDDDEFLNQLIIHFENFDELVENLKVVR